MRHFYLLVIVAFGLSCNTALSQCRDCLPATLFSWTGDRAPLGELPPITTDRPDFTEASSTVGLGVFQIESGYTYSKSASLQAHSWGEPLLRYGTLANWFELRLALSPVSERTALTNTGTEDLYLGAKLALTQQSGFLPEMAIVPQMTVPTGSSSYTADRVLAGTNLLYGWDVTDRFTFGGSTQYNRSVDDLRLPYDEWAQSLTIGRSLTEKVSSYFEWFALFPTNAVRVQTEHYINGGFTFSLSDDVQLDIRAGKGLSDSAHDYFVGTGISFRFK